MPTSKRTFSKERASPPRKRAAHRPPTACVVPERFRSTPSLSFAFEAFQRLATILVQSGIAPAGLPSMLTEICASLRPQRRWDAAGLNFFADLPHVISHWHADAQYLDADGGPRALPLSGPAPSLEELIHRVYPGIDPLVVVKALLRARAIRRQSKGYAPVRREIIFRTREAVHMHALTALMGLLRTAEHNLTHPRQRILERSAINPNVPVGEFRSLCKRMTKRGTQFLFETDAEMCRLEGRSQRTAARRRVGVCVFLYSSPSHAPIGSAPDGIAPARP